MAKVKLTPGVSIYDFNAPLGPTRPCVLMTEITDVLPPQNGKNSYELKCKVVGELDLDNPTGAPVEDFKGMDIRHWINIPNSSEPDKFEKQLSAFKSELSAMGFDDDFLNSGQEVDLDNKQQFVGRKMALLFEPGLPGYVKVTNSGKYPVYPDSTPIIPSRWKAYMGGEKPVWKQSVDNHNIKPVSEAGDSSFGAAGSPAGFGGGNATGGFDPGNNGVSSQTPAPAQNAPATATNTPWG